MFYNCTCNRTIEKKEVIVSFLDAIKGQHGTTKDISRINDLAKRYISEQDNATNTYTLYYVIDILSKNNNYTVMSYKEAKFDEIDLYDVSNYHWIENDDLFVIVKDKRAVFYCLMNDTKIKSLSIIRKGRMIIGWN